jgi:hypothetical protein
LRLWRGFFRLERIHEWISIHIHAPFVDDKRMSTLAHCLEASPHFQLDRMAAEHVIVGQIEVIRAHWNTICGKDSLSEVEPNCSTSASSSIHSYFKVCRNCGTALSYNGSRRRH